VIDVKGEYGPLAEALGRRTIRLEPGGEVRLAVTVSVMPAPIPKTRGSWRTSARIPAALMC
jgi:hypothetical protein